jgi:hypothetical protein
VPAIASVRRSGGDGSPDTAPSKCIAMWLIKVQDKGMMLQIKVLIIAVRSW